MPRFPSLPPARLLALGALFALHLLRPPAAGATGDDFANETLVARALGRREIGIELGADSRVDRDHRLQGWFTPELELGITRAWVVEGAAPFINRGRGLESGGWRAESRYVLLDQPRWPVAVAAAGEYEVETTASKHLFLERALVTRAVVTRTFGGTLLTTVNWGWHRRLAPTTAGAQTYAAGVRYPEGRAIVYGLEYRRDRLERVTHFGPDLWLRLPNGMRLRLGGVVGQGSHLYRYIGRAILEADL